MANPLPAGTRPAGPRVVKGGSEQGWMRTPRAEVGGPWVKSRAPLALFHPSSSPAAPEPFPAFSRRPHRPVVLQTSGGSFKPSFSNPPLRVFLLESSDPPASYTIPSPGDRVWRARAACFAGPAIHLFERSGRGAGTASSQSPRPTSSLAPTRGVRLRHSIEVLAWGLHRAPEEGAAQQSADT